MNNKDALNTIKEHEYRLKNLISHKRQEMVILAREIDLLENERLNFSSVADTLEAQLKGN